jgi:hypothetical protein
MGPSMFVCLPHIGLVISVCPHDSIRTTNYATRMTRDHCFNTLLRNTWNQGHCLNTLMQQWEPRSLLRQIAATTVTKVTVETNCCNNGNQGHCLFTTVISDHIATMTSGITVAFDITFNQKSSKSTVPFSRGYQRRNLLTSQPVLWTPLKFQCTKKSTLLQSCYVCALYIDSFSRLTKCRGRVKSTRALYSGHSGFKSRPWNWGFSWFSSVSPGKFHDSASNRPWLLPFISHPIHYLLVILSFVLCSLRYRQRR